MRRLLVFGSSRRPARTSSGPVAVVSSVLLAVVLTGIGVVGASAQIGSVISAHDTGVPFMFVGATAHGGGALALSFAAPIEVTESARVGGFVLYTATDPSFEPPDAEDEEPGLSADLACSGL